MGFNREVVRRRRENLNAMGVRMRWVGSRPRMWRSVIKEFEIAENMTLDNHVITVNYCVNYGGRAEIAEAAKAIAAEAVAGKLNPDRINEATVAAHLHHTDIPDVDLLIRTSGSNAPRTSCCGRRPTPNTSSRRNSGLTPTVAPRGRPATRTPTATDDLGAHDGNPAAAPGGGPGRGAAGHRGIRRGADGAPRRHRRLAAGAADRRGPRPGVVDADRRFRPAVGQETARPRPRGGRRHLAGHGGAGGETRRGGGARRQAERQDRRRDGAVQLSR